MARQPRRASATDIFHVMNRGVDRQTIFYSDHDRQDFCAQLDWMHENVDVDTLAFCLMSNHFHALVRGSVDAISEGMHHLGTVCARRTNDRVDRDGPLYRDRYHMVPVEDEDYLLWCARYVHRNALDLPGVRSVRDHPWSSYRAYVGLAPRPRFLDVTVVMGALGGGTDALIDMTEDERDPTLLVPGAAPSVTAVRSLIDVGLAAEDLRSTPGGEAKQASARTVMILLVPRVTDAALREALFDLLAHPTPSAAIRARQRAEERLRRDPAIGRVLAWVLARLTGPASLAS